ncbi:MAG: protein phosphatase 2C domain-containing protein [Patescibacteria group bacterium]
MAHDFQIACGSVTGRDHIFTGRNNQDAYVVTSDGEIIVAVVCDGCSGDGQTSGRYSEVGALLGAKLMSMSFFDSAKLWMQTPGLTDMQSGFVFPYAEHIRQDAIAHLRVLAKQMGQSMTAVVNNYFLFTTVVVVITSHCTWIYSIGDGVYAINGEFTQIGPFPGNMPPYLAYGGLVDSSISPDLTTFNCHKSVATVDVESLMIGTDGVMDFYVAAEKNIPGKQELLGPISQFWSEDKYMENPDQIRRRLALANKEHATPDWEQRVMRKEIGLLHDDTTIVVVRRKISDQKGA